MVFSFAKIKLNLFLLSKTRHMADLCSELVKSWKIHQSLGSKLQGIHLEMTGDVDENGYSVTEVIGGSMERSEEDLPSRYLTFCDPRCSVEQVSLLSLWDFSAP